MTLKNRVIMAPMDVDVGFRGRRAIAYYAERARGGVAAVTTTATYVEVLSSDDAWGRPGAVAEFVESIRHLASAIHEAGARIGIQLVQVNRLASGSLTGGKRDKPVAPSARRETEPATPATSPGERLRRLTIAEIGLIVSRFAIAAANVKKAGFDFVELHSVHGDLFCQFLSPLYNRRTDRYGGNLGRRMTLGKECVSAMRDAVGDDFPVFVRIGVEENTPGGITLDDGVEYAGALESAGADTISVSVADRVPAPLPGPEYPMGCFAGQAWRVKQRVHVPVITAGRINRPEVAEGILARGEADIIAIGRQLIADPHWVRKVETGKAEDIIPCISCNACHRAPGESGLRCSVNATSGREEEFRIRPADKARKVLVVGGGPAGMQAALVAAERGHRVTLCERKSSLGGQLQLAQVAPHKEVIADFMAYLVRQVNRAGIEVKLNTSVSASTILDARPDAVVLATGATPFTPQIPGVDRPIVAAADDVLIGRKKAGKRVVIIGGELVACDVAEFLAGPGRKITMLRRGLQMLAKVARPEFRQPVLSRLAAKGVAMLTGVEYKEITDHGLVFLDSDGKPATIEADTVVLATGAIPDTGLAQELAGKVTALYSIGDCVEPRKIREAIHDAARVAREI